MKKLVYLLLGGITLPLWSQGGTEVYTAQLKLTENGYRIEQLANRSQNSGYDNQPSFWSEDAILYASTRSEQTDVVMYHLDTEKQAWRCATAQGSEYSPLRIPGSETFSAIRLDTTGLQRLYRYSPTSEYTLVHPDLKIGYHLWIDATTLLCTVLVDNRMDLYVLNTKSGKTTRLQTQVGRSLHKIPSSTLVSYIHWENEKAVIKTLDFSTQTHTPVFILPQGVQDHAWLPNGHLIYGQGHALYSAAPSTEAVLFHQFEAGQIKNISRLAISTRGNHLALVGRNKSN